MTDNTSLIHLFGNGLGSLDIDKLNEFLKTINEATLDDFGPLSPLERAHFTVCADVALANRPIVEGDDPTARDFLGYLSMELSKLRELADKMPKASFASTFVCVLERIPARYFPNVQAGTMCRLVAMLSENPELVSG